METQNYDIVNKYFDLVQQEIKKLISEDKEIKPSQIEQFNSEIFNQPIEIQSEIRNYIDKASTNNLDIKKVAQQIYDRFKLQVKNNVFNQKDAQNVPNPMLGERKFIKTYEQFVNEVNFDHKLIRDMVLIAYDKAINHFIELHEKITEEHLIEYINMYMNANYGVHFPHTRESYRYIKNLVHRKLLKSKLIK